MSNTEECFYCGCFYVTTDALRDGVPDEYIGTYCSIVCYDRDVERMKQDVIAEVKADAINNPDSANAQRIVEANVGGFNLKINTNIK